jgi:hypothetical protein
MNRMRTILVTLTALMLAFPALAVRSLGMGAGAVCDMVCCAELADEGPGTCECNLGGEAPVAELYALPASLRESEPVAVALAVGGKVLGWRLKRPVDAARPASSARRRPHLPRVRLSVLFCSFLN